MVLPNKARSQRYPLPLLQVATTVCAFSVDSAMICVHSALSVHKITAISEAQLLIHFHRKVYSVLKCKQSSEHAFFGDCGNVHILIQNDSQPFLRMRVTIAHDDL